MKGGGGSWTWALRTWGLKRGNSRECTDFSVAPVDTFLYEMIKGSIPDNFTWYHVYEYSEGLSIPNLGVSHPGTSSLVTRVSFSTSEVVRKKTFHHFMAIVLHDYHVIYMQ